MNTTYEQGRVLENWEAHGLDDSVYVREGSDRNLDEFVEVLPFDPSRPRVVNGHAYLLGIEQIRDVVSGLERLLGRTSSPSERLRAVIHFARHDAFIDPELATDS